MEVEKDDSRMKLTTAQQLVLSTILNSRKSVFFTGPAGTGKSTLLSLIPRNSFTFFTSLTAISALPLNGMTLHQFAGVGLARESSVQLAVQVMLSDRHVQIWNSCQILIIDEISMCSAELFDKIEYVARVVRKNTAPFGGIQLVCCGDFFQLPPVIKGKTIIEKNGKATSKTFCFESERWKECIQIEVELDKIWRQDSADVEWLKILEEVRFGTVSSQSEDKLLECSTRSFDNDADGIEPVRLYSKKRDVEQYNLDRLNQIKLKGKMFLSIDKGEPPFLGFIQKNCVALAQLKLKPTAKVMLIRNLDVSRGLVNGLTGVVLSFDKTRNFLPRVKWDNGREMTVEPIKWDLEIGGYIRASRKQLPLRLSWAVTIHKCQGSSLNKAEVSFRGIFEYGQAYVALSRVRSLKGLRLVGYERGAVRTHPKVLKWWSDRRQNVEGGSVEVIEEDGGGGGENGDGIKEETKNVSSIDNNGGKKKRKREEVKDKEKSKDKGKEVVPKEKKKKSTTNSNTNKKKETKKTPKAKKKENDKSTGGVIDLTDLDTTVDN